MPTKTEEEIKAWLKDKQRKSGDKIVVADEPTGNPSIRRIKIELEKL